MAPFPGKSLVIGISSRALLNLEKENAVYRSSGTQAFIDYQRDHQDDLIPKGVAFPLVQALLQLNRRFQRDSGNAIEVVIISRNHPDCGVRILRSLSKHGLEIPRAAFTGGTSVIPELKMFKVDLFLSYEEGDVVGAIKAGVSAAKIFGGPAEPMLLDEEAPLLAFDGDSTLFSDEADQAFSTGGIEAFKQLELSNLAVPLKEGPMYRFVSALAELQRLAPIDDPPFRIALVTARNFQFMQRPIETLRKGGIRLDKAYLIGGMSKKDVLQDLKALIFFDDSRKHCADAAEYTPTALIPREAPTPAASASDAHVRQDLERMKRFGGLCKLVLRKEYVKNEKTLLSLYEMKVAELSDEEFAARMGVFERSIEGTPKGKLLKERQAVGPENSNFYKLKLFLDNLLQKASSDVGTENGDVGLPSRPLR